MRLEYKVHGKSLLDTFCFASKTQFSVLQQSIVTPSDSPCHDRSLPAAIGIPRTYQQATLEHCEFYKESLQEKGTHLRRALPYLQVFETLLLGLHQ